MNRYNSFYLIHKGLRAMLYDTALTIQQTDFSDYKEAASVLTKISDVLFAFDNHAHHEDNFINPAVEKFEPQLSQAFENEHAEDHRLSNNLKNLLAICENAFLPEERIVCGSAIAKSFVEFMIFNLEHMAKEEILLNNALWKYYTDEQIMEIHKQLQATLPPAEMQSAATWMMRGINDADIIKWLKEVKHHAPEFVYNNLLNIAQEELSEIRFATIQEALEETVLA